MMNAVDKLFWPLHNNSIQRLNGNTFVMSISGGNNDRQRRTSAVTKQRTLRAAFAAIYRTWSSLLPAKRRFRNSPIKCLPLPINAELFIIVSKQQFPGTLKDTGLDPLAIDAVNCRSRGIMLTRKGLPLAAGSKHVNNCIEREPKGSSFTATRSRLLLWSKNRRNHTPQIIRDVPNCIKRGLGRQNFPPEMESPKESLCLQGLLVIFRIGSYLRRTSQ
jgi:hypothetical protein